MADAAHSALRQELQASRLETLKDMLKCRQDIEKKIDALIFKMDDLAGAMNRHLGEERSAGGG
jgi:hypothetical protein